MRSILSFLSIIFVIFALVAGIIGLASLTMGLIIFFNQPETTPETQAMDYIHKFQTNIDPISRISSLAGLFELGQVDPVYSRRAQNLFVELPPGRQTALFDLLNPQDIEKSLVIVVENLYDALEDTPHNNDLLRTMAFALNRLDNRSALKLAAEIDGWLSGRDYAAQGNYPAARDAYTAAIFINDRNPLTRYERALVLTVLADYDDALFDYNTAVRLDETLSNKFLPLVGEHEALLRHLKANSDKYPYLARIVPDSIYPSTPVPALKLAIPAKVVPAQMEVPHIAQAPVETSTTADPPNSTAPDESAVAGTSQKQEVDDDEQQDNNKGKEEKAKVAISIEAPPFVSPGGEIEFIVVVSNISTETIENIAITSVVSAGTVLLVRDISHGGVADSDNQVTWNLDILTPTQVVRLKWLATPKLNGEEADIIDNEVSLTYSDNPTSVSITTKSRSYIREPELAVGIEAPTVAKPGESILYNIVVKNIGPAAVFDIDVASKVDGSLINLGHVNEEGEVIGSQITGNGGERQVFWQIRRLDPGHSKTLTWKGEVDPFLDTSITDSIKSTVTVSASMVKTTDKTSAEVLTRIYGDPIRPIKNATYASYPGGPFVSSLTIQNTGHNVHRIEVTEELPDCVQFPTNISHGGIFEGNQRIVWYLDKLDALETIQLRWEGTICLDTSGSNSSQMDAITSTAILEIAGASRITATATTFLQPLLLLNVSAHPVTVEPDEIITYTLTVQTRGSSQGTATGFFGVVVVRNPIPQYVVVDPASISTGGQLVGNEVVWEISQVMSNSLITKTWTGRIDPLTAPGTQIVNTATADDEWGQSVTSQTTTVVAPQTVNNVNLDISATSPVSRSGVVTYSLNVQNTGQATLFDIEVRDPVPSYILTPTLVSQDGNIINIDDTTFTWTLPQLDIGTTAELIWQGTVDPITPSEQTEIRNEATLSTANGLGATAEIFTILVP